LNPEPAPFTGGEEGARATASVADPPVVLVAARDEADRIAATVRALKETFPGAHIVVADDGSRDGTAEAAMAAGAEVLRRGRPHGKGAAMTAAAYAVLPLAGNGRFPVFLLCDGDLGTTAGRLAPLVEAVASDDSDLAVAAFTRRLGGGFGVALRFARWAIRRRCGAEPVAPISGQRALASGAFRAVVPFAPGYGMEVGMTIDAVRAGYRLREYEIDLEHRATGRSPRGFLHRFRQLLDAARAYVARRRP
jgi:glycosyltransferase involved in cell wall biosynthesis